jgi:hypothetical protein
LQGEIADVCKLNLRGIALRVVHIQALFREPVGLARGAFVGNNDDSMREKFY